MVLPSLTEKYRHKIKTADELKRIIGPRPRAKKVIMCHGVFDVVHPGHLRHLLYAKSKADVLVISITADVHISKGQYRPHVPQDLRALNLAAFEIVDFVLIDRNATPVRNIALLQPVSIKLLAWLLTAVVTLAIVFLCFAQFSRKQTVSGFLIPAAGTLKTPLRSNR